MGTGSALMSVRRMRRPVRVTSGSTHGAVGIGDPMSDSLALGADSAESSDGGGQSFRRDLPSGLWAGATAEEEGEVLEAASPHLRAAGHRVRTVWHTAAMC